MMALAVAAVLAGRTAVAHACSPFRYALEQISPADGATEVPLNTEIRLTYMAADSTGIDDVLTDIKLRAADGAIIDLDAQLLKNDGGSARSMVVASLAAELAPGTQYEILSRIAHPCAEFDQVACTLEEHQAVASFTTGTASDTTAPSFAGPTHISAWYEACGQPGCCGPSEAVVFHIGWQPATDDTPADTIRYHVYRAQTRVASYVATATGVLKCSNDWFETEKLGDFVGENGTYYVRAVDMAGNEDSNSVALEVNLRCDPDDPTGPEPGGCSLGNRTSSSFALWLLAALAVLALRRRRAPGRGHQ
jgi:MYXO-CTERM domain-containing protein